MIEVLDKKNRKAFYEDLEARIIADPERYKYYAQGAKKMKNNSLFRKTEFLSKVGDEVIGQFGYLYDVMNEKVINIEVVCFKDNSPTFIRDLFNFFELLDGTYLNYELEMIPQNPAYRLTCRMFKKYGFRYIGAKRKSIRLLDGKKYDVVMWELKQEEGDI